MTRYFIVIMPTSVPWIPETFQSIGGEMVSKKYQEVGTVLPFHFEKVRYSVSLWFRALLITAKQLNITVDGQYF
jgi:hypothetical protein